MLNEQEIIITASEDEPVTIPTILAHQNSKGKWTNQEVGILLKFILDKKVNTERIKQLGIHRTNAISNKARLMKQQIKNLFVYKNNINNNNKPELQQKKDALEYWLTEHLRERCLTALDLSDHFDTLNREDVVKYVAFYQHENVQILVVKDSLESVNVYKIVEYVVSRQDQTTGVFTGDEQGEIV
nr:4970_t:CDS:2 [Entrophospora candida]